MKIAVMQPYFLPYIGYFQLIYAVDKFIFYDDVNFIKKGWVNRNRILINNKPFLFTIPLKKVSQNKFINEIELNFDLNQRNKLLNSIELAYKKAPNFTSIMPIMKRILHYKTDTIGDFTSNSIIEVARYLEISTEFDESSSYCPENKGLEKADRLIEIAKKSQAGTYINAIGGAELYKKDYFDKHGIELYFLKTENITYKQFGLDFNSNLSIIDVLMFNSVEQIKTFLNQYKLI